MIAISLFCLLSQFESTQDVKPIRSELIDIKHVYVPRWFDTGDIPQIYIEGEFPDQCYRKDTQVFPVVENNNIYFKLFKYQNPGPCKEIKTPFGMLVDLRQPLDEGSYTVHHMRSGVAQPVAKMNIRQTETLQRDDFVYAPVDSAMTYYDAELGRSVLTLYGTFNNNCLSFDDSQIRVYKGASDMIEILPVIKKDAVGKDGEACSQIDVSFIKHVAIPEVVAPGRYLLHIRTMDGSSFNKFDQIGKKIVRTR